MSRLAIFASLVSWIGGCAWAQPFFAPVSLGQPPATLQAIERSALAPPTRYRIIVIPGSGCAGLAPIADRYFAGLLHADILVLHKPGVAATDWPPPEKCADGFIQNDRLSAWRDAAISAIRVWLAQTSAHSKPLVLVGISEGAELLPHLAARLPAKQVAGLVMVANAGLDPYETAALQAARNNQHEAWELLVADIAGELPDGAIRQGRTLGYWRDMRHWPLQSLWFDGERPLWHAWGGKDENIPAAAYQRFRDWASTQSSAYCPLMFPLADHGLQSTQTDHLQRVWAQLERWARQPNAPPCSQSGQ